MNNYTYARFHTFREEESRLESSNLHMQTGVKNFLIRLLRVSLWPRSPKMTATGFSQRGTQNASLYYFLATICLCQEDRQIRIYKNILHSIIIQLFVCVVLFSVVKCKSRENATKTSKIHKFCGIEKFNEIQVSEWPMQNIWIYFCRYSGRLLMKLDQFSAGSKLVYVLVVEKTPSEWQIWSRVSFYSDSVLVQV